MSRINTPMEFIGQNKNAYRNFEVGVDGAKEVVRDLKKANWQPLPTKSPYKSSLYHKMLVSTDKLVEVATFEYSGVYTSISVLPLNDYTKETYNVPTEREKSSPEKG